jgi:hypothetical protein
VVAATGWPQLAQKRAPAGSSDWQLAQRAARLCPQLMQNLALVGFSAAQLGHFMRSTS